MAQNQKSYDNEFKAQAVKLAQEIGGHKAAQELGIPKPAPRLPQVRCAGMPSLVSARPSRSRRMLETFSGACVKENTFLTLQSAGHDFTARGSILVETGWRAVLNEPVEEKEEDMTLLPDIVQGDELPVKGGGTEPKQTRPRPLHRCV